MDGSIAWSESKCCLVGNESLLIAGQGEKDISFAKIDFYITESDANEQFEGKKGFFITLKECKNTRLIEVGSGFCSIHLDGMFVGSKRSCIAPQLEKGIPFVIDRRRIVGI